MSDLISRIDVIEALDECCRSDEEFEFFKMQIEAVSTVDAVPVVRCKDCDLLQHCKISQYLGLDGFCSNADMRKKVEG